MAAINPYRETSIIGAQKKKKRKICIFLFYFLLFFAIFFGIFFSVKSWLYVPATKAINFYTVYSILDATDYSAAETKALETKAKGGAGVVFKKDDKFCAVLAVYPTETDAKKVVKQLSEQRISALILTQPVKSLKLNNLEPEQTEIAQNIYQKYLETVHSLYGISCDLDSNKISQSYTLMRINELALLWEQRTESLANKIDPAATSEDAKKKHPLYPTYNIALYTASQLKYLSNENTYQNSLKTLISVIRQTIYTLLIIDI